MKLFNNINLIQNQQERTQHLVKKGYTDAHPDNNMDLKVDVLIEKYTPNTFRHLQK